MDSHPLSRRCRFLAPLIATAALGVMAAPAGAATPLGSTAGGTGGTYSSCAPQTEVQDTVATRPSYTYTSNTPGVVVSWAHRATTLTNVRIGIWKRTASPTSWFLDARSQYRTLTAANALNTFTESPGIPIIKDEVIGITADPAGGNFACAGDTGNAGDTVRGNSEFGSAGPEPTLDANNNLPTSFPQHGAVISAVVEPDADGDLYGDETQDSCPSNAAVHIGPCAPNDDDADGVLNGTDNCQAVANPDQTNTDADAQGDACDTDDDNDTVLDTADNCALNANTNQENSDGAADGGNACDTDDDNDTLLDAADNCSTVANTNQSNADTDGLGDVCDEDDDGDGAPDASDNCPTFFSDSQANTDGDGQGDACDSDDDADGILDINDNCAQVASADQTNTDGDAQGNVCDADDDGDGKADTFDSCPLVAGAGANGCGPAQPAVSRFKVDPTSFKAAKKGGSVAATGTRLSYVLSAAATVTFRVQRLTAGRRVGNACKPITRRNRGNKPCRFYKTLRGSFSATGVLGANLVRFTGRLRGRALPLGRYRLVATPKNAGGTGGKARAKFKIVR